MKALLLSFVAGMFSNLIQADTNVSTSVSAGNAPLDEVATKLHPTPIYNFAVHNVAFSPDGNTLATGDGAGTVRLWDTQTGMLKTSIPAHENWAFCVGWSRDGKFFATGGGDDLVHLFDAAKPIMPTTTFRGHSNDVHAVVITPDGKRLVSAGDDKQIIVWNRRSGQPERKWKAHEKQIPTIAISPDGTLVASGSRDGTVRLWNEDGKPKNVLIGHTEDVLSVRFSPDGKWLASASYDKTVRLWHVRRGQAERIFKGHTNRVFSVAFASDGKRLASAGDSTVRIWNILSGAVLKTISLKGEIKTADGAIPENFSAVSFSPSDHSLAVSSTTGITYLLSPETGKVWRKFEASSSSP